MPKPERDPLRELAILMRAPEEGEHNIGVFVRENADALAASLGTDSKSLLKMALLPDALLAPNLQARLDHLRRLQRLRESERAERAARELARTATWLDDRVVLDVEIVLGDLLADRSNRFVRFVDDAFETAVLRASIAECRPLKRTFMDLVCFVNASGLAFRWRAARGRLNFYPQDVDTGAKALVVPLPTRRSVRHAWRAIGDALFRDPYLT